MNFFFFFSEQLKQFSVFVGRMFILGETICWAPSAMLGELFQHLLTKEKKKAYSHPFRYHSFQFVGFEAFDRTVSVSVACVYLISNFPISRGEPGMHVSEFRNNGRRIIFALQKKKDRREGYASYLCGFLSRYEHFSPAQLMISLFLRCNYGSVSISKRKKEMK